MRAVKIHRAGPTSSVAPCFLAAVGPILRKNNDSTGYGRSPLLLVQASTFAVSRAGPGIEGEPFRGNPGHMRWSRLENLQPGCYLLEGMLG